MTNHASSKRSADLDAQLELKLVGDLRGSFFVARYQRGYRWGPHEVLRLLEDIAASKGAQYSLQPVVVKRRGEGAWELIDGQQRLTTLYLIFLFMRRAGLQNADPPFSITYETRSDSESYLRSLDPALSEQNIDFHHLRAAYDCIERWFGRFDGPRRQHEANKFYGYLFESIRVIWYEAPREFDSTTLFTRLNVGRIPLTDAELFKALLLSRSRGAGASVDRAHEIAAQWDAIERDLRYPDVWAFVAGNGSDDCPTRITLLLDTLAGGPIGRERPRFHTFSTLQQRLEESSWTTVWNQVVDMHALVLGWFESRDLYHKIGYLVAEGERFHDLVALARGCTKRNFEALLDDRIRGMIRLTPSGVADLSYDSEKGKAKCARLLLLMNVETVRRMEHSTERYAFRLQRKWSLEHIHAQHAEVLTTADQWREWLRLHREALENLRVVDGARRDTLIARIDALGGRVERAAFQDLARAVTAVFTLADSTGSIHSVHGISNLALLSGGDNSVLSNAVFEVKRRRILELDRKGSYIPASTRQVFLKYFSDADVQQVHFWSTQDRESYLNAILSTDVGIGRYLDAEEQPS